MQKKLPYGNRASVESKIFPVLIPPLKRERQGRDDRKGREIMPHCPQ
jgi:hypothetical protein